MTPPSAPSRQVHISTLVSLIIGATIGAGIFALPQNIASEASPGPALIAWAITGVGMLSIAFVFQALNRRKPHLDSGVYAYARAGLGDFVGFCSAWGYWVGTIIAQVGYATLFFTSLSFFLPAVGPAHPLTQAILVSILTWVIFWALSRGIQQAAVMNLVTTVAKVLPILTFIVICACVGFHWHIFTGDFWGNVATFGTAGDQSRSIISQVKAMMLFTVWVFIGIEGASVYSKRARKRSDVSWATLLGFLSVFLMLLAVTILSYGVMPREQLTQLSDNAMGDVLAYVVGPWGAGFIALGLCVSVLGAYISWQMLCAEPISLMAADGLLPQWVARTNSQGAPVSSQLISSVTIQVLVIVFFLSSSTYNTMVQLATSLYLVPYFFSSLYLMLLATRGAGFSHPEDGLTINLDGPEMSPRWNRLDRTIGFIGFCYTLWLFYAAGPSFVPLGAILMLPGILAFALTRRAHHKRLFNNGFEMFFAAVIITGALIGIFLMLQNQLSF